MPRMVVEGELLGEALVAEEEAPLRPVAVVGEEAPAVVGEAPLHLLAEVEVVPRRLLVEAPLHLLAVAPLRLLAPHQLTQL